MSENRIRSTVSGNITGSDTSCCLPRSMLGTPPRRLPLRGEGGVFVGLPKGRQLLGPKARPFELDEFTLPQVTLIGKRR
jgi:hypothetical protein